MSEIVKGLVEGGWALLVGWILPAALNVLLFVLIVYPSVQNTPPFSSLPAGEISLAVAAVVVGVVFSALKTPLYRILEGYTLWPIWLFKRGQRRQIRRRERLRQTVNYAGYSNAKGKRDDAERRMIEAEEKGDRDEMDAAQEGLSEAYDGFRIWASAGTVAEKWLTNPANLRVRLWRVRRPTADERKEGDGFVTKIWNRRPRRQTAVDHAVALPDLRRRALGEKVERYPADDEEILPTVLGNAIRRFERFGPVHYGLDQQRLWYELMATAPVRVGRQVDQMRTAVDFFISLIFGQFLVALAALATIYSDPARRGWLVIGALAAIIVMILSYRGAVVATDEWSYAVQALLNVGRNPLANALSLKLPRDVKAEQDMWKSVGQFLRPKPSQATLEQLNRYRVEVPVPEEQQTPDD